MAVPGLRAGGFMIHLLRSSGPLLGTAPAAIRLREATPARFGPMLPVAPGMPAIVWHAPQPFCWISAAPSAGLAPAGAGAGGGAGARVGAAAGAGAPGAGDADGLTAAAGDGRGAAAAGAGAPGA